MKRRHVFWFFGSLALVMAGYVAWCTHWIWMDAPVPEFLEMPAEYRESAQEMVVEHGLTKQDLMPKTWKLLWFALGHPYEARSLRGWVRVITPKQDGSVLQVMRGRGLPKPDDAVLTFTRERRGWSMLAVRTNGAVSARGLEKR